MKKKIELTEILDNAYINYCPIYLYFLESFEVTGFISNDINELYDNKFFECVLS